jgi:hypothetical protein
VARRSATVTSARTNDVPHRIVDPATRSRSIDRLGLTMFRSPRMKEVSHHCERRSSALFAIGAQARAEHDPPPTKQSRAVPAVPRPGDWHPQPTYRVWFLRSSIPQPSCLRPFSPGWRPAPRTRLRRVTARALGRARSRLLVEVVWRRLVRAFCASVRCTEANHAGSYMHRSASVQRRGRQVLTGNRQPACGVTLGTKNR